MERTKTSSSIEALEKRLLVLSTIANRAGLASRLNQQSFDGDRHIYEALGYPLELTFDDYFVRYDRQDIAKALIDRPVKATWQGPLDVVEADDDMETPLEKAWSLLQKNLKLKSVFSRLDKLTGIGQYGVLLFGMSDVKTEEEWKNPLSVGAKLMYLKPLSEKSAQIESYVSDTTNKRYGLPFMYRLEVEESDKGATKSIQVHYSRVLHIVEDMLENEVIGTPRLKNVFNRLMDLEKIVGGDAEMFWKGARPGYVGKVDKDYNIDTVGEEELRNQIDEYEHNLRRMLVNQGVSFESLAQQVADPLNHVDIQIQMISAATGIPKRILIGSERGELSSSQDSDEWKTYIQSRREEYAELTIIRPFVDKCVEMKVLPAPKEEYSIKWADLFAMSEKERVDIGKTRTEALKAYADSPMAEATIPPAAFLEYFVGLTPDQISIIEEMREQAILEEPRIEPEEEEEIEPEEEDLLEVASMVEVLGGKGSGIKGHRTIRPGGGGAGRGPEGWEQSSINIGGKTMPYYKNPNYVGPEGGGVTYFHETNAKNIASIGKKGLDAEISGSVWANTSAIYTAGVKEGFKAGDVFVFNVPKSWKNDGIVEISKQGVQIFDSVPSTWIKGMIDDN
ncbi:MAG: DUF1073 domain-containing protein [Proteobacteria bacterium]|nr:DUF1073 domain-containing protein [Pseudomonadota bacterium]